MSNYDEQIFALLQLFRLSIRFFLFCFYKNIKMVHIRNPIRTSFFSVDFPKLQQGEKIEKQSIDELFHELHFLQPNGEIKEKKGKYSANQWIFIRRYFPSWGVCSFSVLHNQLYKLPAHFPLLYTSHEEINSLFFQFRG